MGSTGWSAGCTVGLYSGTIVQPAVKSLVILMDISLDKAVEWLWVRVTLWLNFFFFFLKNSLHFKSKYVRIFLLVGYKVTFLQCMVAFEVLNTQIAYIDNFQLYLCNAGTHLVTVKEYTAVS